jgi:hypothetical protein
MNENDIDKIIDDALFIPIPDGLEKRLEQIIGSDNCKPPRRRKLLIILASISTAAALVAAVWLIPQHSQGRTDTFSDPKEAAAAAQQMLSLVSHEMEEAILPVNALDKEVANMNRIINKYINK